MNSHVALAILLSSGTIAATLAALTIAAANVSGSPENVDDAALRSAVVPTSIPDRGSVVFPDGEQVTVLFRGALDKQVPPLAELFPQLPSLRRAAQAIQRLFHSSY